MSTIALLADPDVTPDTAAIFREALPGQYVKANRGRTAFLIVEVVRPKSPCGYVARLRCERTNPANLPSEAIVHPWAWSSR